MNNAPVAKRFHLNPSAAALAVLFTLSVPLARGQVMYTLTDLGNLNGGTSRAYSINNSGQVTGESYFNGTSHAFLYSGGKMTDLGTLFGSWSQAYAINNNGQVAGDSDGRAFLYTAGHMLNLGMLGTVDSCAYGLNDQGQVVGGYATASGVNRAFLYNPATGMTDIPNPFGGSTVAAQAINDHGVVLGFAATSIGTHHGFLYSGGVMTDLGTLDGGFNHPYGLNNAGQAVGTATAGTSWHAFLADGHSILDLNNVVTNATGWTLNQANSINDQGQIVGWGTNPAGKTETFLLTPIPEPSAGLLLGLSGASLLLRAYPGRAGSPSPPRAR